MKKKMTCGPQLHFLHTIIDEMYEKLGAEKLKNAQFQCLNFVNDDETQFCPLCNFLNSGYRICGIE